MDAEVCEAFPIGRVGADFDTLLDVLAAIYDSDPSALEGLSPSTLVVAVLNAKGPSGISVART